MREFTIREINNGWLLSFYNEKGQQTFWMDSLEDLQEVLVRGTKRTSTTTSSDKSCL